MGTQEAVMRTSIFDYAPILATLEHKSGDRFKVTGILADSNVDFSTVPNASVFKNLEDYKQLVGLSLIHNYKEYQTCPCEICHVTNITVDLNTVDITNFNPSTRRWRKGGTPTVRSFEYQLVKDIHQFCEIPNKIVSDFDKKISAKEFKEGALYIVLHSYTTTLWKGLEEYIENNCDKVEEDTEYIIPADVNTSNKFPGEVVIPRFTLAHREGTKSYNIKINSPWVKSRLSKVLNKSEDNISYTPVDSLTVPKISNNDINSIVQESLSNWSARNIWNSDPPSSIEFEDNTEMLAQTKKHLSLIPGLEITYLRKKNLVYCSDGGFSVSPDAADKSYQPSFTKERISRPILYSGNAWEIRFTIDGKDYIRNNHIYFCTPDQYVASMKEMGRGDLVGKDFVPWSDLLWISSDWCERNGSRNYNEGIDLSSPNHRRLPLYQWILGPFFQKCIESGLGNPLEGYVAVTSAKLNVSHYREVKRMEEAKSRYNSIISKATKITQSKGVELA